MPYDFRNVTVPLGQLLFRKRNERWRNEAEDADTQRRVAAEPRALAESTPGVCTPV